MAFMGLSPTSQAAWLKYSHIYLHSQFHTALNKQSRYPLSHWTARLFLSLVFHCKLWYITHSPTLPHTPTKESVIHEFDPWFNYRTTRQLVEHGYYDFVNWFDELSWYPLGRVVGGTVYPGIMLTAGVMHWFVNLLNFPVYVVKISHTLSHPRPYTHT